MQYSQLTKKLLERGFTRVERDDRLLDVWPKEVPARGVELWQKWTDQEVQLVRLRLPFSEKKLSLILLPRPEIERMLIDYEAKPLDSYPARAIQEMFVKS